MTHPRVPVAEQAGPNREPAAAVSDRSAAGEPSLAPPGLIAACRRELTVPDGLERPEQLFDWLAGLADPDPGRHVSLFGWLARRADRRALGWFVAQEIGARRGLADQFALAQLGVPASLKPQLAVSFWEEMGQGVRSAMPDVLLERLAAALAEGARPVEEATRLAHLGQALARDSDHTWQSVGFLAATELTLAARAVYVDAGLRRLELPRRLRAFYARHARADRRRARRWVREVIRPAVQSRGERARPIVEGALLRIEHAGRLWDRCEVALVG